MVVCPVIQEVSAEYSIDKHSSERKYVIRGVNTRTIAETEIAAFTAVYDGNMIRKGWSIKQTSNETWEATVRYSSEKNLGIGDTTIRGTTRGGTFRATHALQHIATKARTGESHPGHGGAINVTKDSIDGVDVDIPTMQFTVSKGFAPGTVNDLYRATLTALSFTVNDAPWYGFARGECLFRGAEYDLNLEIETVSYDFEISPNLIDYEIGDPAQPATHIKLEGTAQNPAKEGWHYAWVEFEEFTGDERPKQIPLAIHIERLYEYGNLLLLGI